MLELQGLHKRFGDVVALNGVSFEAKPGYITGFLGRNGAGKSTTMRSVFGLVNLDAGEVRWQGQPVDEAAMARFGFMPEQRGLYRKMPILTQVSYFAQLKGLSRSAAKESATRLLTDLDLGDRLGDKLEALSHGNQQRVQLASALVHQPDLCLLDEPFNGLDPTAVRVLNRYLRSLADDGRAVLFSSHQLDLVEGLCDEVIIIDHGEVRAAGSVSDVRKQSGHSTLDLAFQSTPDWARLANEGFTATGTRTGSIRLNSPDRLGHLLQLADESGSLTTFSFDLPSLSDVFEEVTR